MKNLSLTEDLGEDIPMDVVTPEEHSKGVLYVRLDKHSRAWKTTFKDQFDQGLVKKLGNIRVGKYEFDLEAGTVEVPMCDEVLDAIRSRLLVSGGRFHYVGNKPKVTS